MAQITLNSSGVASSGSLLLQTNGTTTQATVDTSGNLGLGVTPSAWNASIKVLEMPDSGFFAFANTNGNISTNTFFDTGYKYKASAAAARYSQSSGQHIWYNAASGTAGNSISFTQAMTLDASGNFMVGATSANGRARFVAAASADCILNLETSTNNYASGVVLTALNDNGAIYNYIISKTNGGTEHWKIGGVGASSALAFSTGGTERARIDSSGNLLVGTTSSSLTSNTGFKVIPGNDSYIGVVTAQSTNANSGIHLYSTGAGAYRFYVGNGGTVYATSTTISAISDIRFKENVRDLDAGLAEIMALKPRLYDWKEGKGADIKNARGFIAQEFEEVFPDLIDEWKDPSPEGEEPYKSVRQDLIPVLVKAIQELKAELDAAKARITALEA